MLTPRQHQVLKFIAERQQSTGITPSYAEIGAHMGIASKSTVSGIIYRLEERGFIRRPLQKWRSIEILKMPGSTPAADDPMADLLRRLADHARQEADALLQDFTEDGIWVGGDELGEYLADTKALIAEAEAALGGRA
ncbi:MAG: MarR family transcriptional regulator [Alphaproteobacteria bacterium]|nr:MarR family transcriptional regulator [Alphaproteobacteria bacterium]